MPNWVFNELNVKNKETLEKYMTVDEVSGEKNFDFNKIIKRPEELDITSPAREEDVIVYLTNILSKEPDAEIKAKMVSICGPFSLTFKSMEERIKDIKEDIKNEKISPSDLATMYSKGGTYARNLEKYGASEWYSWSIKNWGVKWNACNTQIVDENNIMFDTPWGIPVPVLIAMSKQNPEEEIEVYSEEETGWWERSVYKNGVRTILAEGDEVENNDD